MQNKKLPSEWLNELKAKNDIVNTISSYIPVVKKGRSYWARCPFHHEKTPSFAINNDEQYYHCFGCGESGDVITFVEKMESISTGDAIRKLADKAGIEMPRLESGEKIEQRKKERDEALKALKLANEFYIKNLYEPSAKLAQEYIKKRGFKKSDLERFEIGYSKENTVISYLEEHGINQEVMLNAGIIGISQNNKPYDHIYNRLVFPIFNTFGDCVGFSGRILEAGSEKAKYKNTSQTIVFDKSYLIYGLHLLKEAKKRGELDYIILVEGQIDVIMLHSFGFRTAVASLGTAFTDKHAEQLKRISENIILLFDSDSAGRKATLRTIDVLKPFNFNIKVARLPVGSDPDDFLKQKGSDAMKEILTKAKTPIEYQLDLFKESSDLTKPNDRARYIKQSLSLVSQLKTMSEREVYLKIISENSSIPIDILRRDANVQEKNKPEEKEEDVLISRENGNIKAIKYIMTSILKGETFTNIDIDIKKYVFNPIFKKIITEYEKFDEDKKDLNKLLEKFEDEEKNIINELIEVDYIPDKKYFDECVWKVVETSLLTQQDILNEEYKASEDREERLNIAKKLSEIIKQLKNKRIY